MRICNYAFVLVLALAASSVLVADPIGTFTGITGCYTTTFGQNVANCETDQAYGLQTGFSAPSQASYSGNFSVDSGAAVGTASGDGYASGGVLKASSYATITSASTLTFAAEETDALMLDTITISDPLLNGTDGSLVLGMSVDATGNGGVSVAPGVATTSLLAVYAGGTVNGFPTGSSRYATSSSSQTINTSYEGPTTSFVFGTPFSIELYIETAAGAYCTNTTACASYNSGGQVFMNAYDTAVLDSLSVYDSNDNPISSADWSVTAESGLDYAANGVVPEPSSYAVLALCFGVLALVGWLRPGKMRKA